ncbi:glutaredoxin [Brevibacillus sp. 179-C9.3 HS]|uniref:glutaredoxin n=1 Tax=unclassified Brevibacillus TaxID=2684853 RepID=UPI0039A189A3
MGAKIEIFVDGSQSSSAFVQKVKGLCCSKCEVVVHNKLEQSVTGEFEEKTKAYGIESLPAVTMDGKVVDLDKVKFQ